MTTKIAGGAELDAEIASADEIVAHIERQAKRPEDFLIGMEYERLGVYRDTGKAISYDGAVERILNRVAEKGGWTRGMENGRVIFLERKTSDGDETITLEPGGQTEYASSPAKTIAELMRCAHRAGRELDEAASSLNAAYLGLGYQPFSGVDEIAWVPKARYAAMAPYLARHGRLAHEMMKMTAGCQISLDFSGGADAMRKLRAALLCTPIAQALFAASSVGRGRGLGYATWRAKIWTETDDDRCNTPAFMMRPGATLEEYVAWLMDMPLMFIDRNGTYLDGKGVTLRRLMNDRLILGRAATLYDAELAMTQAFPEARIKRYVEVRSCDTPHPRLLGTVPCFWTSILYGDLDAVFELFKGVDGALFAEMREQAMRRGLAGEAGGRTLAQWARELLAIADQTATCRENMAILRARVERGATPADRAREILESSATPAAFVERWENEHARERGGA